MEDDREERRGNEVEDVMNINDDDAAFVLGRGGQTKKKIARACGANLTLDEQGLTITMTGTKDQVRRCIRCCAVRVCARACVRACVHACQTDALAMVFRSHE